MKQFKAIINTRVSTPEQLENNSLNRQLESVIKAAEKLGAIIPEDGRWSGSVSSKAGTNVKRKDLLGMLDYCKRHKDVKYAIFDEYDRFMRSGLEGAYFEVLFRELGVKVWFASESDAFNADDAMGRLMRSMGGFKAEASNEERQRKSVSGHEKAIREGRYTFPPKPGYMKGPQPGVHLPDPMTHKALKTAFQDICSGLYSPLEALKKLNQSEFIKAHGAWKMDKFRQFAIDPYYAGILEMNKQVKARNGCGQHQAMISLEEHEQLLRAFNGSIKPRGPKKQYNPDFPMNKVLTCEDCGGDIKFTGSRKNNGYSKKVTKFYYKYHCRGCGKAYHRDEVHQAITERLNQITYTGAQRKDFLEALATVWEKKQKDKLQTIRALEKKLAGLEVTKSGLVLEMARTDEEYKQDIRDEVDKVKAEMAAVTKDIEESSDLQEDLMDFMKFALEYTNMLKDDWWELSHDDRVRCQLLIIPGGISFNSLRKVGTPLISPIYSFQPNKKALRFSRKALMEELAGTAPASIGLFG